MPNAMPAPDKRFRTTPPGMLTAPAAIITALGALLAALVQAGWVMSDVHRIDFVH